MSSDISATAPPSTEKSVLQRLKDLCIQCGTLDIWQNIERLTIADVVSPFYDERAAMKFLVVGIILFCKSPAANTKSSVKETSISWINQ